MLVKEQGSSSGSKVVLEWTSGSNHGTQVSTFSNLNRIEYGEGRSHNPDGSSRWKACTHTWMVRSRLALSGEVRDAYGGYHSINWFYPGSMGVYQDKASRATARVKTATLAEMFHAAEYVMEGRMSQTLLPFTDLFQLCRKVEGLGPMDAVMTSLLAPFRTKPKNLSELVKKLAGADLAWKFGVKTLIDTMLQSLRIGAQVDAHLQRLTRIQNAQQRNFKVSVNDKFAGESGHTRSFLFNRFSVAAVEADYQVSALASTELHFKTSVRYDTSDAVRTRLVWDALGLSNIFSTAWDLVPLSFVVDWFVGVQKLASRLDSYYFHTVPLERMCELQDVWVTSTVKGLVTFSNIVPRNQYGYTTSLHPSNPPAWTLEVGRFTRYPADPVQTRAWLPTLEVGGKNLTLAQNLTGLELMVQRTF